MTRVAITLVASLLAACARTVVPASPDADVVATGRDAGVSLPCGDTGVCGPGEICVSGRCGGCCTLPPRCEPIPTGCAGTLACGCFTRDPCAGCNTCLTVDSDGIHCGNCNCRCAAPWTPIDTPDGPRAIADLHVGDLVYSLDRGLRVIAPIVRTVRTPVAHHAVARVTLVSGAVLEVTGRHPTADGRTLDALRPGDLLGDARIVSIETENYDGPFTYDILPDSDSGTYFAAGALLGSTLR